MSSNFYKILSHFEINDCMPLDAGRVDKALSVSMGVQDWRFALSTLWKRRQRRPEKTVDLQEATWKVVWPSSTSTKNKKTLQVSRALCSFVSAIVVYTTMYLYLL